MKKTRFKIGDAVEAALSDFSEKIKRHISVFFLFLLLSNVFFQMLFHYTWLEPVEQLSDLAIPGAIANQIFHGVGGKLYLSYYHLIAKIVFSIPFFGILGFHVFSIFLALTFYLGIFNVLFAFLAAKDKKNGYNLLLAATFSLASVSFYAVNIGHIVTFMLIAVVLCLLYVPGKMPFRFRCAVVFLLCVFGGLNDPYFILCCCAPFAILIGVQFLLHSKINSWGFLILAGTMTGKIAAQILKAFSIITYPSLTVKTIPVSEIIPSAVNTFHCLLLNFPGADLWGVSLTGPGKIISFFSGTAVLAASLLALVYAIRYLLKYKFTEKDSELIFIIVTMFFLITFSYCFIDSPTKPKGMPVFRYLFFAKMCLLFLLCHFCTEEFANRRFRIVLFLCILLSFCLNVYYKSYAGRAKVAEKWKELKETAQLIQQEKIDVAYAEWWSAYSLWLAGHNSFQVYPMLPTNSLAGMHHFVFRNAFSVPVHSYVIPLKKAYIDPELMTQKIIERNGKPEKQIQNGSYRLLIYKKDVSFRNTDVQHFLKTIRKKENIVFGNQDDWNCYRTTSGFSEAEPWGIWSDGEEAEMYVALPEKPEQYRSMKLTLRPFLSPKGKQTVEILINDVSVKRITFSSPQDQVIQIPVPEDANDVLKFDFYVSRPTSPAELGMGPDARTLGFGFISLVFQGEE